MKNRRAILFFLFWNIVFAVALALLHFSDRSSAESAGSTISSMDVQEIVRIRIDRVPGKGNRPETVSIVRMDGKWRLETPVSAEADEESVKKLIDAVVFAKPSYGLSEKDLAQLGRSPRDFGLMPPRCSVTVFDGVSSETFHVGKVTAAGDEVYASRQGKKGVFTVPVGMLTELTRPLVDFRRRRLFTFSPSSVMGIALKDAGETLTRLAKTDGQWRIVNPVAAPADRMMVEDLIRVLCSAHVIDYVTDAGAGHGLGDGEGFAISLRDTFGAVEKIVLGAADGTNAVWAVTSEGAVVHVDAALLDRCKARKKTLEDTRVFPVEAQSVMSFSVSRDFPAYVVSRTGPAAPWTMVSPVDALADLKTVEGFLARILSLRGADLVDGPGRDAVMVSVGTHVTNFNARYVSDSVLPPGMRLADLLGKTMVRCCHERVKRITVKTAAGDEWNAAGSDEVVDLLEAGVAAKRVETVVIRPEDFRRFGFDRPAYTISFELSDEDSSMRRMLIGAVAPDGGRYAVIGGSDAAFVLSAATVSVLTKPVDVKLEKKR